MRRVLSFHWIYILWEFITALATHLMLLRQRRCRLMYATPPIPATGFPAWAHLYFTKAPHPPRLPHCTAKVSPRHRRRHRSPPPGQISCISASQPGKFYCLVKGISLHGCRRQKLATTLCSVRSLLPHAGRACLYYASHMATTAVTSHNTQSPSPFSHMRRK